MSRVLVTGASGFIGAALTARLRAGAREVAAAGRNDGGDVVGVGAFHSGMNWRAALRGVSAVVHLAGPAHTSVGTEKAQRAIVDATEALAAQATEAGIGRFVYLSSIKACADRTQAPVSEAASPAPRSLYGRAKLAAEAAVLARPQVNPVVLRPPLVHDVAAKGNWARLLRLLDSGLPLPLGGLQQRRSLISLSSLVGAIITVLDAPAEAPAGVFHVADRPAVTVARMAALLREGMGRTARLFDAGPFSALAPSAMGESLEIDATVFRTAYGHAGDDTEEALRACGRAWVARR